MKQANLTQVISQVSNLYITYRKQFLEQTRTSYITQKYNLTDSSIKQHLECSRTLGLKLGTQGLTKFQVFDVDMKEQAQEITIEIVRHLVNYYGIEQDKIHVSFSGGKGYHIALFYDEVVQDTTLLKLYDEVIEYLKLDSNLVEFRPTKTQGVKLPLSVHKKTNNFMCFCSYDLESGTINHLDQSQSIEYFLNIKPMELAEFKELVLDEIESSSKPLFSLKSNKASEFENIMSEISYQGKTIEDIQSEIVKVLNCGRLLFEGTRNRITFLLSMFYKEQGYELDETIEMIQTIMLNTYDNTSTRELISSDTTREFVISEVIRVSRNTYEKDYSLSTRRKEIQISKEEILQILNIKEKHLKQLAFSFLIHSKRYAKKDGSFYLTYSTLEAMGNSANRSRTLSYIKLLEEKGFIEVHSSNVIDLVQTRLSSLIMKKPNIYKCTIKDKEKSPKITLRANDKVISYQDLTLQFFSYDEIKHLIPRGQQKAFKEILSKTV